MKPKARLNEEARSTEGKLPKRVVLVTLEECRKRRIDVQMSKIWIGHWRIGAAIRMLCPTDG